MLHLSIIKTQFWCFFRNGRFLEGFYIDLRDKSSKICLSYMSPDRRFWSSDPEGALQERDGKNAGSSRNTPEHKDSIPIGNFLVHFDHFSVLSTRNRSKIIGKNAENFWPEYSLHVLVQSYQNRPVFFDLGHKKKSDSLFCNNNNHPTGKNKQTFRVTRINMLPVFSFWFSFRLSFYAHLINMNTDIRKL